MSPHAAAFLNSPTKDSSTVSPTQNNAFYAMRKVATIYWRHRLLSKAIPNGVFGWGLQVFCWLHLCFKLNNE